MKRPAAPTADVTDFGPPDARDLAISVLREVVWKRQPLDDKLERLGREEAYRALSLSDRGLVRAIVTSAVRGLGLIRKILADRLRDGMPTNSGILEPALIAGAAQILFLDVPDYAAVDTTMTKIRADRRADRYASLANAILRAIARQRDDLIDRADPLADNTPAWLAARWTAAYGADTARAIAFAHTLEPALDLSVKSHPAEWAAKLGGTLLPTGTVRVMAKGSVPDLPGFEDGAWWVQDAAAAIPARLLKAGPGDRVLDLCAAPGGKTAQLAAAGASVVAVDRSAARLKRLEENLARLGLTATTHAVDGLDFADGTFRHILLDAPCSATGTIRRHPDVAWNKTLSDIGTLAALQSRLIDKAWSLLEPGGRLVYATCSLEPEEGEQQIGAFLARTDNAQLIPVTPEDVGGLTEMVNSAGMMRALPSHLAGSGGCDGFFAAVLEKTGT